MMTYGEKIPLPYISIHRKEIEEYVQRITAEAALNHEWFREVPLPKSKDFMPTFPAHHAQDRYHSCGISNK